MAYPNPFITSTTFEFAVKETTPVTISIYDMNGKKVTDLITSKIYSQGNYALKYNGAGLAIGTYLCMMTTKDEKKTIKIIKTQ